jgi:hypothetical protein
MKAYWYEVHTGTYPRKIMCIDDSEVLATLRARYGQDLIGVSIIYEEEADNHNRTVWME